LASPIVDQDSDETLIQRARDGCRKSFAALLSRHYDSIHRFAWRWCGSRDLSEDVAQDVCIKLASAIRTYRGDAAFSTWLYRIVFTTSIDHLRLAQRNVAVEPSHMVQLVDARGTAPNAADDDDGSELWTAVRRLPPQQRDAVLLIYGEDMSHAEAAHIMGCRESTVSWHVHEAKKKLKVLLEAVG
jgi:RNA polymerase sigma-70 factor, ECF subfamily